MSADEDDIARAAFELLLEALPSDRFSLIAEYDVPGKIAIHLKDSTRRVVLAWKSNNRARELTTRNEYVPAMETWFPSFTQEAKEEYYSQILPTPQLLLDTISHHAGEISKEIWRVSRKMLEESEHGKRKQ